MSIQAVAWAISQRVGSPTGKVLLICLANYANERGECWPSQRTIAHEAELSRRTAITWLYRLEKDGFINRKRRQSKDGFRTSDLVTLQLNKLPEPSEPFDTNDPDDMNGENQSANSAPRPNQGESDGRPKCNSRSNKDRQVHSKEPSPKPLKEPSSGARARRTDGFKELWDGWPREERPDKIKAAKWTFDRLSTAEQSSAVQQASKFRRLAKANKDKALMIPYLKNRDFKNLANAPEINADGKFILTPKLPEWSAWREHFREKYSDKTVAKIDAREFFLVDTRWPPNLEFQYYGEKKKA